MAQASDEAVAAPAQDDPYHLTPQGIQDPPQGWGQSLRYLGPGLILSVSIVGSGELIATTTMGAQAGFALLWIVIFSCAVKVGRTGRVRPREAVPGPPAAGPREPGAS